jgi:hypothetical protein
MYLCKYLAKLLFPLPVMEGETCVRTYSEQEIKKEEEVLPLISVHNVVSIELGMFHDEMLILFD